MTDWIDIVSRFERQLDNPDLTNGERECLEHRIRWITLLHRPKPTYHPSNGTDILLEAHKDPSYRCTPASMLQG
jgi:hypothetical protein